MTLDCVYLSVVSKASANAGVLFFEGEIYLFIFPVYAKIF
jgi:hypothetical protein